MSTLREPMQELRMVFTKLVLKIVFGVKKEILGYISVLKSFSRNISKCGIYHIPKLYRSERHIEKLKN